MMYNPKPSTTFTPSGSKRWWKWLSDRRLTCADKHHIPNVVNIDAWGSVRCNKWIAAEKRECGRWIWLFHIPGGGNIVADVSLADIEKMKEIASPSDKLDYLGIFAEDIPSCGVQPIDAISEKP